jgi:hypothetical protein
MLMMTAGDVTVGVGVGRVGVGVGVSVGTSGVTGRTIGLTVIGSIVTMSSDGTSSTASGLIRRGARLSPPSAVFAEGFGHAGPRDPLAHAASSEAITSVRTMAPA